MKSIVFRVCAVSVFIVRKEGRSERQKWISFTNLQNEKINTKDHGKNENLQWQDFRYPETNVCQLILGSD
jgi:hypothetical protein